MRVGKAADTNSEMVGTMREGKLAQKHLLFGEDGSPNNYDLNMGRAGSGAGERRVIAIISIRSATSSKASCLTARTSFSNKAGWVTSRKAFPTALKIVPRGLRRSCCNSAAPAASAT